MKSFRKQRGFALPVSLMLLVVMTLMGTALVSITTGDMRSNNDRDASSQAFYAAESGISMAKQYLKKQSNYNPGNDPSNQLRFCKTNLFPNLRQGTIKAINSHVGKYNLNQLISASGKEQQRLGKFSFEYFITHTPDKNGYTSSANKFGTGNIHYTIYSCGCDGTTSQCRSQNNNIIALEAVVTIRE